MRKPKSPGKTGSRPAPPGNGPDPDDACAHCRRARAAGAAPGGATADFKSADAFVWHAEGSRLVPVPRVNRVDMSLLKGIDRMRDVLMENTERFARGLPANNALLWGARGMGKSSLVKAAHAARQCRRRKKARRAQADRNPSRGYRKPARADDGIARRAAIASSCSATTCRSTATTPPTSRSRRCWKAASRAVRKTSSSTPPRTAGI